MARKKWFLTALAVVSMGCSSMPKPGLPTFELPKLTRSWVGAGQDDASERTTASVDAAPHADQMQQELAILQASLLRGDPEIRIQACQRLGQLANQDGSRFAASELLSNVIQLDPNDDVRAAASNALRASAQPLPDAVEPTAGVEPAEVVTARAGLLRRFWK